MELIGLGTTTTCASLVPAPSGVTCSSPISSAPFRSRRRRSADVALLRILYERAAPILTTSLRLARGTSRMSPSPPVLLQIPTWTKIRRNTGLPLLQQPTARRLPSVPRARRSSWRRDHLKWPQAGGPRPSEAYRIDLCAEEGAQVTGGRAACLASERDGFGEQHPPPRRTYPPPGRLTIRQRRSGLRSRTPGHEESNRVRVGRGVD
jgi:hypothetical protein